MTEELNAVVQESPQELFALASELAIAGDISGKLAIYQRIAQHVEASGVDRFRVAACMLDAVRRDGDAKAAIDGLLALEQPQSIGALAQAEFLMALEQCVFVVEGPRAAIPWQRKLISLPEFSSAIPPDKQLYYLETHCELKVMLGEFDAELDRSLASYREILERDGDKMSTLARDRQSVLLLHIRGDIGFAQRRESEWVAQIFADAFAVGPALRNKAFSAARLIYTCHHSGYSHPLLGQCEEFLRTQVPLGVFLATDFQQPMVMPQLLEFVFRSLGIEKPSPLVLLSPPQNANRTSAAETGSRKLTADL